MKKLIPFLLMLFLAMTVIAQTPKISYQAVVRDANNRLVTSTTVIVDIVVTYGSNTYSETGISATTNANGLLSLQFGGAIGFNDIDWSNATITSTIHIGSESVTNTVPVTATPYALYAQYSSNVSPTASTVLAIYNKLQADSMAMANGINDLSDRLRADSILLHSALIDSAEALRAAMPTVNDGTLTITYGTGTSVVFTANQAGNSEITIPVPAAQVNADWEATSGAAQILNKPTIPTVPTNVSDFTNDANYVDNTDCNDVTFCQLVNLVNNLQRQIQNMQKKLDSLSQGNQRVPTVTTSLVNNITQNSAVCGGEVTDNGGASVAACGVCWNTTGNPTIEDSHTTITSSSPTFTSNVTGLDPNTTYYVRAYAINNLGVAYGDQRMFTTFCGTVNVTISGNTDINYGQSTTLIASGAQSYVWNVVGNTNTGDIIVSPLATSTYTVTGTDSYGCTGTASVTINVNLILPTITSTYNVTNVSGSTATSGGNINFDGGAAVTARGVCWSTLQNPTIDDNHTTDGSGIGSFNSNITGLDPSTTYYVRAYATNSVGTAYGMTVTFTTLTLTIPTVTTNYVYDVTQTSAICIGRVTNSGNAQITACGVCWNTTGNPTIEDDHTTDGNETENFDSHITGLVPSTTYYVRVYATNSEGTAYGETVTFTTMRIQTIPTVITSAVSDITKTSATCGGEVTDDGGLAIISRGVCWNTVGNPTIDDNYTTSGSGTYDYTSNLYELTAGTTYYVRAYATNALGTAYGETVTFTTLSNPPTVTTGPVTDISTRSARVSLLLSDYNNIIDLGVCWSQWTSYPTISSNDYVDGLGDSTWLMTPLEPGYTYYVRAFAIMSDGTTVYGQPVTFNTLAELVPTVVTSAVSDITNHTAICGGEVTDNGHLDVTAYGVCWNTTGNPTRFNSHTTDGTGMNSFTSSLDFLAAGTTYYIRAYAVNSKGTGYGEIITFTTEENIIQSCGTVTDIDGNTYNTVVIGEQCWMKENLRTTKYPDGSGLSYKYPDNNEINVGQYGLLYTWNVIMDGNHSSETNPSNVQGICPNGWHIPSKAETDQLINYLQSYGEYHCNNDFTKIASALSSNDWVYDSGDCCPGNQNSNTINASGFSALPAGYQSSQTYYGFGFIACFWTSSGSSNQYGPTAYNIHMMSSNTSCYSGYESIYSAYSVRCVHHEYTIPTVNTSHVSNLTENTAICGGVVTDDGGADVTARGVCWNTTGNPTINDSHTTDGIGIGEFTSNITGLIVGTPYYVRAYATNSAGTAYGDIKMFVVTTSSSFICGTSMITDIDNNTYNTVLIGDQCWMKENLRTTKYADGTIILAGTITSTTTPYRYTPGGDGSIVGTYGYLYNWNAVMNGASSNNNNSSNVQGICPEGWHVPSYDEYEQMFSFVRNQREYWCNHHSAITMALASTEGWQSSTNACTPGYQSEYNNTTGFSLLPAGCYRSGVYNSFFNFGTSIYLWTSTEAEGGQGERAYEFGYSYSGSEITRSSLTYEYGCSVRCIRD
ncbi:MAG: hypothetical protein CW341_07590 [Bacteroidetes bacterium]|nr:hypothetical protein [Bacteroidota bacterium]